MSEPAHDLAALAGRVGHAFADPTLLEQALSHRSVGARNYERLEFLGDGLLNFAVAAELFRRRPDDDEGSLSRLRASLVRESALAAVARWLALGDHLRLGGGELASGGFERDSILADAVESIVGAVFLDAGFEPAENARVLQGFVEGANVNAIGQLARMIEVQRGYEMGQKFLEREDERIRTAIKALLK